MMEKVNDELWDQLEEFGVRKLLEPYLSAVVRVVMLILDREDELVTQFLVCQLFQKGVLMIEEVDRLAILFSYHVLMLILHRIRISFTLSELKIAQQMFLNVLEYHFHLGKLLICLSLSL